MGEPVGMDGVPVVHPACEVLKADQWRRTLLPELAVGEAGIADGSKLGWGGVMQIVLWRGRCFGEGCATGEQGDRGARQGGCAAVA